MATDRSDEEKLARWRERAAAPENELPVGIEPFGVLARNDSAVITVTGVQVYSTGLSLDLMILVRKQPVGARSVFDGISRMRWIHEEPDYAEDWLWLGVEYADGRRASNADHAAWDRLHEDEIYFSAGRGGSSGRTTHQTYWLSPLPPARSLLLVCTWPRFDISQTETVVDTAPLLAAASRVEVLWPVEPDDPWTPPAAEPVSEWFTHAMRQHELRPEE